MDVMYLNVYSTNRALDLIYIVKQWAHPATRTPHGVPTLCIRGAAQPQQ